MSKENLGWLLCAFAVVGFVCDGIRIHYRRKKLGKPATITLNREVLEKRLKEIKEQRIQAESQVPNLPMGYDDGGINLAGHRRQEWLRGAEETLTRVLLM